MCSEAALTAAPRPVSCAAKRSAQGSRTPHEERVSDGGNRLRQSDRRHRPSLHPAGQGRCCHEQILARHNTG
jgi:hypothetical protein